MGEDVTLGEFLDEAPTDEDGSGSGRAADGPTTEGRPDVEPAETTLRFDPDGATCADCGTDVRRRWDENGALVCPDCKEW